MRHQLRWLYEALDSERHGFRRFWPSQHRPADFPGTEQGWGLYPCEDHNLSGRRYRYFADNYPCACVTAAELERKLSAYVYMY